MQVNFKAGALVAAAGVIAIAVPAAAHPGPGNHPGHGGKTDHPSKSHKCTPHNVGYVESGTIDASTPSTLAQNPDGTWSGTLVIDVTRTNHWAKADRETTVTETFTDAKLRVRFDGTTSGFTGLERVHLIGKLAVVAKKCTATGAAASPVFRMIVVHASRP
jgi:hypothetical protein